MAEQKYEKRITKKSKSELELTPKFKKSIAKRTKLRKQRLNEIAKKEKMISKNLF